MPLVTASNRKRTRSALRDKGLDPRKLASKVADNPWALSFTGFMLTAIVMQWDSFPIL